MAYLTGPMGHVVFATPDPEGFAMDVREIAVGGLGVFINPTVDEGRPE